MKTISVQIQLGRMSVLYDDDDDDDDRVANDSYYVEVSNGIYESYSFHISRLKTQPQRSPGSMIHQLPVHWKQP